MYNHKYKYRALTAIVAALVAPTMAHADLLSFGCTPEAANPHFACHGFVETTVQCDPVDPNPEPTDVGVALFAEGALAMLNELRSDQLNSAKVTFTNGPWDLTTGLVLYPDYDTIDPGIYPPTLGSSPGLPTMERMTIMDPNGDYETSYKMTVAALNRLSGASCDGATTGNTALYAQLAMANNGVTNIFYPSGATPPNPIDQHGQSMSMKWNYSSVETSDVDTVTSWLQTTLTNLGPRALFAKVASNRPFSGTAFDSQYHVVIYWPDYDATHDSAYADWFQDTYLVGWAVTYQTGDDRYGAQPVNFLASQVNAAGQAFQDHVTGAHLTPGGALFAKTLFNRGDGALDYECAYGNQVWQMIPQFVTLDDHVHDYRELEPYKLDPAILDPGHETLPDEPVYAPEQDSFDLMFEDPGLWQEPIEEGRER